MRAKKRERKREKALGGLDDLIDKVDLSAWHDLSATRGRAFTFFSLVFPFVSLSHDPRTRRDRPYPRPTLRFLHRRYYPRRNAHVVCATCFFRLYFSPFPSSLRFQRIFFPIQNVNRISNLSKADVLIMKNC